MWKEEEALEENKNTGQETGSRFSPVRWVTRARSALSAQQQSHAFLMKEHYNHLYYGVHLTGKV